MRKSKEERQPAGSGYNLEADPATELAISGQITKIRPGVYIWNLLLFEQPGLSCLVDQIGREGCASTEHEDSIGCIHIRLLFKQSVAYAFFIACITV